MDKIETKIARVLKVGKLDFITGILFIICSMIFIVAFIFECKRDSFSMILIPFVSLLVMLTFISANIKILTYRNALLALKAHSGNKDELSTTNKYIKKALKRNVESNIMDIICSLIWLVYVIYSRFKYLNGDPLDGEIILHYITGVGMMILSIVRGLPGFKAFSMYFNTNKEEKE